MHLITTYDQTATYEPTNQDQVTRVAWTNPKGYSSFYFNQVPNPGSLSGLRGLGFWAGLPAWGQILLVGAGSAAAGFFAMKKWGNSTIKPALRKVGINLAGPRGRRR